MCRKRIPCGTAGDVGRTRSCCAVRGLLTARQRSLSGGGRLRWAMIKRPVLSVTAQRWVIELEPPHKVESMADEDPRLTVGASNPELNERLSRELSAFNDAASGDDTQRSLSIEARSEDDVLLGGLMGWTWGTCAGVEMLWVDQGHRRTGWGGRLMRAAEAEARARGCTQLLVSSLTFQAPDFYRRLGYKEFARSEGLPMDGMADVHFRKDI